MSRPIGVFDSGLGGLTVLKSLVQSFPSENFIYLGDTARLPYGSKSPKTIYNYLYQNINYLRKFDIKGAIVACNSASSVLRPEEFKDLPVVGVIEAGTKAALNATQNKRIGVIGTRATIGFGAYQELLKQLDDQVEIFAQACPLFVPLVEEGLTHDPLTNLICFRYLKNLVDQQIDTLILGCTHYPLLKPAMARVLGPNIQMIDSADAIAELVGEGWSLSRQTGEGSVQVLCTDTTDHFKQMAGLILDTIKIDEFEKVDL